MRVLLAATAGVLLGFKLSSRLYARSPSVHSVWLTALDQVSRRRRGEGALAPDQLVHRREAVAVPRDREPGHDPDDLAQVDRDGPGIQERQGQRRLAHVDDLEAGRLGAG